MSFTLLFYENPDIFAQAFPAPAVPFLIRVLESADPTDMENRCAQALAEVTALNVLIAAAFPDDPDLVLTLTDVEFAGGGDGHTFVTTLVFVPANFNSVASIIGFESTDLLPGNFTFFFGLASEQDALQVAINETIVRSTAGLASEPIFQFFAGAAKGTRFMFGMGAIVEGVGPQFADGSPGFARTASFNGDGGTVNPLAARRNAMRAASAARKAQLDAAVAARKASAKKP